MWVVSVGYEKAPLRLLSVTDILLVKCDKKKISTKQLNSITCVTLGILFPKLNTCFDFQLLLVFLAFVSVIKLFHSDYEFEQN